MTAGGRPIASARMEYHDPTASEAPLRVLLIAELANPDWISVPLVGWSHWQAIARITDAHLVTHVRNQENILQAGLPPERFTAMDTRPIERVTDRILGFFHPGARGGHTTITALSVLAYYDFERQVWQTFGRRIAAGEFDVVHRVTPLSPAVPSLLARKCARVGVPFVLGPLNGGLPWPKGFGGTRLKEQEWLSYVREAYKLLPGYRSTRRHAAAIVCASREARRQVPRAHQHKTVYVPENAIDPKLFVRELGEEATRPLRVVFVGRLTPLKACDILIEAAAPLVRAGAIELEVIGDGAEMATLRALARKEQLPDEIFVGWVKHAELRTRLARAHVFAFPSIRDFGGGAVIEAMALGLVPIVMDFGGPGELVTRSTGFVLPMGGREEIIRSLRAVLETLAESPSMIRPMGVRARERVLRYFTWDAKAAQVVQIYRWVLGRGAKPDFDAQLLDDDGAVMTLPRTFLDA